MKGFNNLKRKRLGSSFVTFLLVFIAILLYYQYMTKPEINPNVPSIEGLHPIVQERTNQLVQQAAQKGISIIITDDFRSAADQDLLYAKGRSTKGNIVTYAKGGESYHNFGLAVDFAIKTSSNEVIWDMKYDGNQNSIADWTEVVQLAKELGFEWGGDWTRFKDYPHLQMNFGLSIADLQRGQRPSEQPLTADLFN